MSPYIRALGMVALPSSKGGGRQGERPLSERRLPRLRRATLRKGVGRNGRARFYAHPGQEHRTGGREVALITKRATLRPPVFLA